MPQVSPASIAAAALVMQFFLITIVLVGGLFIRQQEKMKFSLYTDAPNFGRYAWFLLVFALTTIGLLIFSDQFSELWRSLSNGVPFAVVRWTTALRFVFGLDVVCVATLVWFTGGSYRSPFTPVYFILPALAFFLREPTQRIAVYTLLVSILFLTGLAAPKRTNEEEMIATGPYAFVSIACLILSVLVGYMTRPN